MKHSWAMFKKIKLYHTSKLLKIYIIVVTNKSLFSFTYLEYSNYVLQVVLTFLLKQANSFENFEAYPNSKVKANMT